MSNSTVTTTSSMVSTSSSVVLPSASATSVFANCSAKDFGTDKIKMAAKEKTGRCYATLDGDAADVFGTCCPSSGIDVYNTGGNSSCSFITCSVTSDAEYKALDNCLKFSEGTLAKNGTAKGAERNWGAANQAPVCEFYDKAKSAAPSIKVNWAASAIIGVLGFGMVLTAM